MTYPCHFRYTTGVRDAPPQLLVPQQQQYRSVNDKKQSRAEGIAFGFQHPNPCSGVSGVGLENSHSHGFVERPVSPRLNSAADLLQQSRLSRRCAAVPALCRCVSLTCAVLTMLTLVPNNCPPSCTSPLAPSDTYPPPSPRLPFVPAPADGRSVVTTRRMS